MRKSRVLIIGAGFLLCGVAAVSSAATGAAGEAAQHYLRAMISESQGNLEEAQESFKRAVELAPESAYIHTAAAENAFRLGQYDLAAAYIRKAVDLDSQRAKSYVLAGQIFWAQGDITGAEEMLRKAVQLAPDEAEPLIYLAMALTPKEPLQAVKLYEDYLNRHPGEVELRDRVAQLYQGLGDLDKAKESWAKILEWDPESMKAHLALAQIAEVNTDTATAISHYLAVLDQDPKNFPLLLRLGELRYRSNSMAEAEQAFAQAQSISPDSASANFWLALLSEYRGDWKKAIELLEIVRSKSGDPGILLRLSYYYSQDHQQSKAIKILEELSASDPHNTDFMTYLALAYEEGKKFKKAEATLVKLVALKENDPELLFHLATLYDKMGRFEKSETLLKRILELKPDFAMALNYLGYSYADRNMKLDEAEEMLTHAVSLNPTSGAYLDSLGWLYFRQGKLQKAEDFLSQAVSQTADPLILEHAGEVKMALDKVEEAVLMWDESLRLQPRQKKIEKKISAAVKKLDDKGKIALFALRAGENFRSLDSSNGVVELQVCSGKSCLSVKAQFSYEKEKELRAEIPGPLSGPVMLVVKPAGEAAQFGSIHPLFQSVEMQVKRAFENLYQVLSGDVFIEVEGDSLAEHMNRRGSMLEGRSGEYFLSFNSRTGAIHKVKWNESSYPSSLEFQSFQMIENIQFPKEMWWLDEHGDFSIRFKFLSPVIGVDRSKK